MHNFFAIFWDKRKQKSLVIYALSLATFLVWTAFFAFPEQKLHIWFLEVGQGDAILMRTPRRNTVLIDGGPGEKVLPQLGKVLPYWEKTLDLVIITHWDADHITGLAGVLENYKVANVAYLERECASLICEKVKNLIGQEGARKIAVGVGNRLELGKVGLDVFWPPQSCSLGSNNCSVVFLLGAGSFEALFSGDVGEEGQLGMTRKVGIPRVELLKVPHHGADCLGERFLDAARPDVSVISVGKNAYGHPTEATLAKLEKIGSRVFRTDRDGTVEIISDGRGWWVQ